MGLNKFVSIGFGNMAKALIEGAILAGKLKPEQLIVFSPSLGNGTKQTVYTVAQNNQSATKVADLLLLATKPKQIPEVCREIGKHLRKDTLIVSVAAGITTSQIQESLGTQETPIIRVMPNTPVAVRYGTSGLYTNPFVTEEQLKQTCDILNSTGITIRVKNEDDINKVTAISGSGPAYIAYIAEQISQSAIELGLTEEEAYTLTEQTLIGTAIWIRQNNLSLNEACAKVMSKGGTTEAAIRYFTEHELSKIISGGIKAAYARAVELGKENQGSVHTTPNAPFFNLVDKKPPNQRNGDDSLLSSFKR